MTTHTHASNGTTAALSIDQAIEYGYPVFVAEAPADRALASLGVAAFGVPSGLSTLAPPEALRGAALVLVHGSDDEERQRMQAHAEAFLRAKWISVKVLQLPAPTALAWTMMEPRPTKADLVLRENLTPLHTAPKPSKGGPVDWMVAYAEKKATLVISPSRETYARLRLPNGNLATYPIQDPAFAHWLARTHRAEHKTIPPREAVRQAQETLDAIAREDGKEQKVFLRVARVGDEVYVDLGDPSWQVVQITSAGVRVLLESPVAFWRSEVMSPMPLPILCSSDEEAIEVLGELHHFFRVATANDAMLLAAWLVYLYSGTFPYPIVSISGDQDSGKSTTTDFVKRLVDPGTPKHLGIAKSKEDLMVVGRGRHLLSFDNLSYIPAWFSDALCSIATGAGIATRTLFTNKGQSAIALTAAILVNGIDDVVKRHDLSSRTLRIHFANLPVEKRVVLRELEAALDAATPRLLGGLFHAVSIALRDAPKHAKTLLPIPTRLMDFLAWGRATEHLYAPPGGSSFDEAFKANFVGASQEAAEDDAVVNALRAMLEHRPQWEGTARELLDALHPYLPVYFQARGGFGPEKLAHHLRSMRPVFDSIGVTFTQWRETGKERRRMMSFSLSL